MAFSPSRIWTCSGLVIALFVLVASRAWGANFVVDATVDAPDATPGDGVCAAASGSCTLRAAVEETNALAGADVVSVPAGVYVVRTTLVLLDQLTILGAGRDTTTVDGALVASPVFVVVLEAAIDGVGVKGGASSGIEVIGELALTSARVSDNASAGVVCGGGVSSASLDMIDTEILGNGGVGVDIFDCNATIEECVVAQNQSRGLRVAEGGGSGSAFVQRSEIRGNLDGGIQVLGLASATLAESTVADNEAAIGGGVRTDDCGSLNATNSTISGNSATGNGGGVYRGGGLCGGSSLSNTTVANNVADSDDNGSGDGGGVFDLAEFDTFDFEIRNSIIADNLDLSGEAPDCFGKGMLASLGFNLIGDSTGCVLAGDTSDDQMDVDPKLGGLASNGGPTRTHALLPDSPAIDAIAAGECTTASGVPVGFDQRGVVRPQQVTCDTGAYERESAPGVPAIGLSGHLLLAAITLAIAAARLRRRHSD